MKTIKLLSLITCFIFATTELSALQTGTSKGVNVNNKGASATNSKGGGVVIKKQDVSAKGNKGNGVGVDKKGLEVKGTKGGMTTEKKSLQIKSKNLNVKLGK